MSTPRVIAPARRGSRNRPRLALIGPILGRNPGFVLTPGDTLENALQERGWPLTVSSRSPNRWRRLLEIVGTLARHRRALDAVVLFVYGGRSFVVEDAASALAKRSGVPIVMSLHGGAMPEFMDRFPSWSRRVLRRAHTLVAPSLYLARAVRERGYAVEVIPNTLDLSTYAWRQRERVRPRMLWMRAFHHVYRPEMAVEVLERVRARHPEASLVLAGQDRGGEGELRRLVERRGLTGAVRFAGFLDEEGKRREGAAADIFLNTTRVDNQPVAVLEACAMGMPVVATSVGGIPDLIADGVHGLLVADGDADAMAAAVLRLIEEPGLAAKLSRAGRELAAGFEEGRVMERWEALLQATADGASA